jgi:hypothetical protein
VQAAEFTGQCLAAVVVDVGNHDLGVFACKAANAGFAYALGATGDDADAACQAE